MSKQISYKYQINYEADFMSSCHSKSQPKTVSLF